MVEVELVGEVVVGVFVVSFVGVVGEFIGLVVFEVLLFLEFEGEDDLVFELVFVVF